MPQICLVTRELAPFQRGGIGTYAASISPLLADVGDVTVIASAEIEDELMRLAGSGDQAVDSRIEYRFIEPPDDSSRIDDADPGPDRSWSAAALDAILDHYGSGGPDLIEFADFRGDAYETVRARTRDERLLRRATVAIRAQTTYELCRLLNGTPLPPGHPLTALERQALRGADVLLWPAGDVLAVYRRFYGVQNLPAACRIRFPIEEFAGGDSQAPPAEGPLRVLYLGRFERRKGVVELVEGFMTSGSDAWRLTMIGGDTPSGPADTSLRDYVREICAGDPRFAIADHLPRRELPKALAGHHLLAAPSRFELWGYVAIEALQANRPVLVTPVGGLKEIVDSESGWQTTACSPAALERSLAMLLANRDRITRLIEAGGPRRRCAELTEPAEIRERYQALVKARDRRPTRASTMRAERGGVAVIVTPSATDVERTIDSALGQTVPVERIWIAGVAGSAANRFPAPVERAPNVDGLGSAPWNARALEIATSEYVVLIGAGDILHPEFVAETVAALTRDPGAAIAYTDVGLFGPELGRWRALIGRSARLRELPLQPLGAVVTRTGPPNPPRLERLDLGRSFIPRTCLLRREAVIAVGGVDGQGPSDHADLFRRLLWHGWRATYLRRALVGLRLAPGGTPVDDLLAEELVRAREAAENEVAVVTRERDTLRFATHQAGPPPFPSRLRTSVASLRSRRTPRRSDD